MDVRIYWHGRYSKRLRHDDTSRFVTDAWKTFEFFQRLGDEALMFFDQDL